jgi:hypothetical protein
MGIHYLYPGHEASAVSRADRFAGKANDQVDSYKCFKASADFDRGRHEARKLILEDSKPAAVETPSPPYHEVSVDSGLQDCPDLNSKGVVFLHNISRQ